MSVAFPSDLSLRLHATSANLGPGFDALALALALYLEIDASAAPAFSIDASGRSPEVCSALEGNLLLDTYTLTWRRYGGGVPQPLRLRVHNGIPLGMGCGSSAASRLAGIALASHFGSLHWDVARMLDEAAALEHHPDNAAACCLGGLVASVVLPAGAAEQPGIPQVQACAIAPPPGWHALLVLPEQPLATTASRAVLPAQYPRADVVQNLQNAALLVAAFAQGNGAMLAAATRDHMHQPFRAAVCPLLPRLLPLAGRDGILSVTLSGAGSGILLLLAGEAALPAVSAQVLAAAAGELPGFDSYPLAIAELLACELAGTPALLCRRPDR